MARKMSLLLLLLLIRFSPHSCLTALFPQGKLPLGEAGQLVKSQIPPLTSWTAQHQSVLCERSTRASKGVITDNLALDTAIQVS